VHFNLLGFMAMMIYGVGYFVLPRFNARELRWPLLVPLHFWASNVGLVGLVATYPEMPSTGFAAFGALSAASVLLFAVNIGATVLAAETSTEGEEEADPAAAPQAALPVGPDTRVGELLTRWPATADVLVAQGLTALADPAHREQVKQLPVTLAMACQRHGLDLEAVVGAVREVTGSAGAGASGGPAPIRADQVLGDILAAHPETEGVFRKYYGSGCFSCPGQATETVKQSAMIHNVDVKKLLEELNRAAKS
jgi:hybrid cluster-associated redox disulfide protein